MTAVYGTSPVKRLRRTRAELAAVDEAIIAAVELEHPITLRGVFYRAESAGAVEKTQEGYDLIQRQLLKLRRNGVIPYDHVIDGTRWVSKPESYDDLDQMLEDAAASYRRALWRDQAADVHIYSEKDAISSVILPVTERWDVPLGIVRGYASESFAWQAAMAVRDSRKRIVYVYQLGDHDPSGVDAWRAFRERVTGFLGKMFTPEMAARAREFGITTMDKWVGKPLGVGEVELCSCDCEPGPDSEGCLDGCGPACPCKRDGGCLCDGDWCECGCGLPGAACYMFLGGPHFHDADSRKVVFARLAVTAAQIRELGLPTRPTKRTDTRAQSFDGGSVELDAVPPTMLRQIVTDAITRHIEPEALRLHQVAERSEREVLERIAGDAR
ncbi:MAG: hypothetical protein J2P30_00750 [Actinobacteria bacterium]|nr:hypothetical protein [Actinomycetota bacterium]